jgi:uncharacterized surface protein with fasciclin (FAS1) repeats
MSKLSGRIRAFRRTASMTAVAITAAVSISSAAAAQATHQGQGHTKNIVDVATSAGSFKTLLAAVKAAGLVETLQGDGPFTVFAPSDAAFAKIPKAKLDALLADKAALTALLTYHVVPGRVMAADIVKANGAKPATVNGQSVDVTVRGGKVYVGSAQVVSADVQASNGVIHVIDTVLMPAPKSAGQ